jgi:transposase
MQTAPPRSAAGWIRLGLTAGQAYDGQVADALRDHLGPRTIVLADKAYDADRIRELRGCHANIPPKCDRRWKPCFSKRLYRERNLIERTSLTKAPPSRRHPLRQARRQLPRHGPTRSMRLWPRAYESRAYARL